MTTLRQMRFLVALADTGNFSRAAEQCHVTQSTLSTGLKEMESRLGVRVAERTTHAVIMTPVGAALANRARQILASVGDFEEMARAAASESALQIRLGTIPTVGSFLLPRALPILRKTWPRLKVYLREELTDALVSGLQDGRLDVILLALPHGLPENIETEILFDDGYKMALPRDHPLANLEKIEGPDLAGRDLLLLERGHCLQNHALSSVPGVVLSEDASFSATSLPTLVSMVEEGLGVTLLPRLATDAGLTAAHDIHLSELAHATPRQIALAWRKSTASRNLFQQIGEVLRDARRSLGENT